MESGQFLESSYSNGTGARRSLLGPRSQSFIFYSILCVLLKSEALFTFFVYWLRSLQYSSGTIELPNYNTLSHLWLLKPFFSLLIDKMDVPLSQRHSKSNLDANTPPGVDNTSFVQYGSFHFFLNTNSYRVLVLLVTEYLIAVSSFLLYLLHTFNSFHTFLTTVLVYLLGLSLVCASSYSEGLFGRYVRTKRQSKYVKYVAMRMAMSSAYAFTTLGCILFPIFFYNAPLGRFFQINIFFPLFLTFNALFITWLVSRPLSVDSDDESELGYDDNLEPFGLKKGLNSMFANYKVNMPFGPNSNANYSEKFSLQFLGSLLVMLLVSMRLRNEFFNRHNHTKVDNYLFILSAQFYKFLISLFMYKFMGTVSLKQLCMAVFGSTILLLYPFKSYTSFYMEGMSKLGHLHVLVLGFILSFVQQVVLSYSLTMCLHLAPKGYEASILSLPSFVAHVTLLCLRNKMVDYLDLSPKQRSFLNYFGLVFLSSCFVILSADSSMFYKKPRAGENTTHIIAETPEPPLDE